MTNGTNGTAPRTLNGERILLRPFSRDDLRHVIRWYGDDEVRRFTGEVEPMTADHAEDWFRRMESDRDRVWFAIVVRDQGRVIGEAGLLRIFRPWRCADMSVVIGEKDAWGVGYGTETGRLLLDLAFQELGLHRVSVGVVGFNEKALRFWESLGFKREGVQRDGYRCDGDYSDFVMMSILEDER